METLWFALVAFMITGYVVLDGFDLGTGIVHLLVARTDAERRQVLKTIGPVWDGNEVWLLAAGGTLFFAFPKLYASSFSGFYLPLMIVLWLLILRGISIEFRNHIESHVWAPLWDVLFAGSSGLLAVFFGAALGNVVRGVPLDERGEFFLALWTDFRVGPTPGILDWYTILTGVLALAGLTLHGAAWVSWKSEGHVCERSRHIRRSVALAAALLTAIVTAATFAVQPVIATNLQERPWGLLFPALALGGLYCAFRGSTDAKGFLGSCTYLVGMLGSVAIGLFPYVLPSVTPGTGLTVYNTATGAYGLSVGLIWWIPGMLLAVGYFTFLYYRFAGRIKLDEPA